MTIDETFQLAAVLKRKSQQASRRHFGSLSLPEDRRSLAVADTEAIAYMSIFSEERNDDQA